MKKHEKLRIIGLVANLKEHSNSSIADICDLANKHGLKYGYCKACENDMPHIDGECLICGQSVEENKEKLFPVGGGWMNSTLTEIIVEFRDGDEPLDGDEVEKLIDILRAKINFHEGNITEEEYEKILG